MQCLTMYFVSWFGFDRHFLWKNHADPPMPCVVLSFFHDKMIVFTGWLMPAEIQNAEIMQRWSNSNWRIKSELVCHETHQTIFTDQQFASLDLPKRKFICKYPWQMVMMPKINQNYNRKSEFNRFLENILAIQHSRMWRMSIKNPLKSSKI